MAGRRMGSYGYQQTEGLSGAEYLASIYGTEKDKVNCSFYFKVSTFNQCYIRYEIKIVLHVEISCLSNLLVIVTVMGMTKIHSYYEFHFFRSVPVVMVINAHELIIDQHFHRLFYFRIFTIILSLTCVKQTLSTVNFSSVYFE